MSIATRYYYLDNSMGENFDEIFKTAQLWAVRAIKRLEDTGDSNFHEVFKRIFKTSVSDTQPMPRSSKLQAFFPEAYSEEDGLEPVPVLAHVRRELLSFAHGWTRTSDHACAEVRIHRNGKARYVQEGPEWLYDPINDMLIRGSKEQMKQIWSQYHAFVVKDRRHVDAPKVQDSRRNVIEFTERSWEKRITWEAWQELHSTVSASIGSRIPCLKPR